MFFYSVYTNMPKKPKTNPHSINFSSLWSTLPIFVRINTHISTSVSLSCYLIGIHWYSATLKGIVAKDELEWIIFTVLFPQKFSLHI